MDKSRFYALRRAARTIDVTRGLPASDNEIRASSKTLREATDAERNVLVRLSFGFLRRS